MASGREYEMLFQLNAQMGGSYNSTFKSAQQTIISMQREIEALGKVQSDISAYQKQQSAVEATGKKLEVLQRQYDNIQREIKETEEYSSSLENKLLSKQQQIDKTTAALEQQNQKLGQMDAALRSAGVNTGELTTESAKLGNQIGELQQRQEEAAEGAEGFGSTASSAFGAVQEAIVAAGIAKALKEIYDEFMGCVTIAGDFEESMSNVEALSGATQREMKALTDEAKELGATTKFTAQESAEAMGYMAMAGWDATSMISGMDGVLQLAAASGEDLALVSDIVTDSLSAFGLKASDTAHFSDVLAAAATNANTNVAIMGETFKNSASVAGALGYSIEDVALAVGLMANNGVKGSIAGTALKNTFNGLLEGVTLTSNAFGEYEYSAIEADGTMKSFGDTIDELRGYFEQMTEAERANNAMTLAGKRGYNGLLAILNATEEDYTSLAASIDNCTGAASKMAAIKLDNMNGELVLMNSAWDALDTTIGEQFTPELRELYKVGTSVFQMLNDFVQKNPGIVKAIAAFAAVFGTVTVALTAYSVAAKVAAVASKLLTDAIPGAAAILGITGMLAGLIAAVVALSTEANTAEKEIADLSAASRQQYYEMRDLEEQYDQVCATLGETSYEAQRMKLELDEVTAAFDENKQTAAEAAEAHRQTMEAYTEFVQASKEQYDSIELETASTASLINRLEELVGVEGKTAATKQEILGVVEMLNRAMPELGLAYDDYADKLNLGTDAIKAMAEAEVSRRTNEADYENLLKRLEQQTTLENARKIAADNRAAANEQALKAEIDYADAVAYASDKWRGATPNGPEETKRTNYIRDYEKALDAANATVEDSILKEQEAQDAYKQNEAEIDALTQKLADYNAETGGGANVSAQLGREIQDVAATMDVLAAEYQEVYEEALKSVQGQFELWDKVKEPVATSASAINAGIESQITYWEKYNTNLEELAARSDDIQGLGEMLSSFADGSKESISAISGMASASDSDLAKMVENWKKLQNEQKTTADKLAEMETDFTNSMNALQTELEDTIAAMNLEDEAALSGKSTIQGYINAADYMLPKVQNAYARVANAAKNAIELQLSLSKESGDVVVGAAHAEGGILYQPHLGLVAEDGPEAVIPLSSARRARGIKLWQEAGQMMGLYQQEKGAYLPATEAEPIPAHNMEYGTVSAMDSTPLSAQRGALGGTDISITLSPTYHIEGNANAEAVSAALQEHDEELREMIMDMLKEAASDMERRAYR